MRCDSLRYVSIVFPQCVNSGTQFLGASQNDAVLYLAGTLEVMELLLEPNLTVAGTCGMRMACSGF
jgi:hypothetical protein